MEIAVPSIMHSGTHVLRYKILRAFFKDDDEDYLFNGNSKNVMHGFHVDQAYRFENQLNNGPVFAPLRHPARIAKSWKSRERTSARIPYTEDNLWHQFELLMDLDKKYDIIYLHVDHHVREHEVELIEQELGVGIVPDFSVDRRSGAIAGNHDVSIKDCPEVPQRYINFYNETITRMMTR